MYGRFSVVFSDALKMAALGIGSQSGENELEGPIPVELLELRLLELRPQRSPRDGFMQ